MRSRIKETLDVPPRIKSRTWIASSILYFFLLGGLLYGISNIGPSGNFMTEVPQDVAENEEQETEETVSPSPSSSILPSTSPPINDTVALYEGQKWLNQEELVSYLNTMGIRSVNISPQMGRAILNVDWNSASPSATADRGRMISVGFESYHNWGSRWGAFSLIQSSYDFEVGAEYDTYAKVEDYEKIKKGEGTSGITVDEVQGIVNYNRHNLYETIEKYIVFPFADGYLAINYRFKPGPHNSEDVLTNLYAGNYPPQEEAGLKALDELVGSLRFSKRQ